MTEISSPTFRREARDALVDIAPAMVAAAPIGLLFGAVAATKGLTAVEAGLASATIFAGGAQLAAIELWGEPVPVAALVLSTFLINARYILMSAHLAPKVRHLPLLGRLVGFHVLADENWALSERRAGGGRISASYFFVMGVVFWLNWTIWSIAGALVGPLLGDPTRFGADFAFTALFVSLVSGLAHGRTALIVVVVAAAAAALAHLALGPPWHVLIGAFSGIAAAAITAPAEDAP